MRYTNDEGYEVEVYEGHPDAKAPEDVNGKQDDDA